MTKEQVYREALQRILAGQNDIETAEDQVRWMWSVASNAIACGLNLPDEPSRERPVCPEEAMEEIDVAARKHFYKVHGLTLQDIWEMQPVETKESYRDWVRKQRAENRTSPHE